MRTFFTADTHYGHASIIRHVNRIYPATGAQFASVNHMDAYMIDMHNAVVGPKDRGGQKCRTCLSFSWSKTRIRCRVVIHDGLRDGGFDVHVVTSGAEALALLQSAVVKYSALVTDIRFKDGENKWEVARQARESEPRLAVVYATSAFPDDWRAQGVPNSILLEKPFAVAQLLTAVSQLLNTGDGAARSE
jgi:CheY-like chemotaxis protein